MLYLHSKDIFMNRFYTIIFVLLTALSVRAQVLPAEKIFFAADNNQYEFPDTIVVEGRLIRVDNDTTMVPFSDYVYLELFDSSDSLQIRQKLKPKPIRRSWSQPNASRRWD